MKWRGKQVIKTCFIPCTTCPAEGLSSGCSFQQFSMINHILCGMRDRIRSVHAGLVPRRIRNITSDAVLAWIGASFVSIWRAINREKSDALYDSPGNKSLQRRRRLKPSRIGPKCPYRCRGKARVPCTEGCQPFR